MTYLQVTGGAHPHFDGEGMIFGDAGNDTIDGGGRSDILSGGIGTDLLIGATGRDNLSGGRATISSDTWTRKSP